MRENDGNRSVCDENRENVEWVQRPTDCHEYQLYDEKLEEIRTRVSEYVVAYGHPAYATLKPGVLVRAQETEPITMLVWPIALGDSLQNCLERLNSSNELQIELMTK